MGLAPDGGLFMPETIPAFNLEDFQGCKSLALNEIAAVFLQHLLGDNLPAKVMETICAEAFNFPVYIVETGKNTFSLELFHGPTLAFKDIGARFMSRLLQYYASGSGKEITVVTATSGDTGSAVAAGFHGLEGVKVYVLFPEGKVSPMQQKQITTWGGNVHPIAVKGSFDDCQKHVKAMLADPYLQSKRTITSANSINIARLLPQTVYYLYVWSRLFSMDKPMVISVPSGNFGNLTAGLIAAAAGLPVNHFIAATNSNDTVPRFFDSGMYLPKPSQTTISNAMDVGNPSNFERMLYLFDQFPHRLDGRISSEAFSDEQTRAAIHELSITSNYQADPHGAVGYLGLKKFLKNHSKDYAAVFLETAHPAKFAETVEPLLQQPLVMPERLQHFANKAENFDSCENSYEAVRAVVEAH